MKIKAPAKINLYLDVVGKKKDGYHEIVTLFNTIKMHDVLDINFSEKEYFTSNKNFNIPWKNNIIKKTIDTFKNETGFKFNLNISLEKHIPQGGGLGGGSADAAAVLRFLKEPYQISDSDIIKIGAKVGADVPFMIFNGTAIGKSIGEDLEYLEPLDLDIDIHPQGIVINTGEMYKLIDKNWSSLIHNGNPHDLYKALKNKDIKNIKFNLFNIFEQVVFPLNPSIYDNKNRLENKNTFCLMSGSGSTLFTIKNMVD
ncbi:4-(cytidine 5'-diphospho)-2-C-methyl-D-erythritol kinase [Geotoga petraea]|jgi:4-diphosphocytidyl-2-C-methyl-D-erythritol kinase|uniref:4-diphosphocytidyl-2-C-methyl-D-erythritol kinase n=1 Tax=Geotoga petraea TaxID=28234 RepID=A0A1G6K9N2_9BACT|nr:4-(cytidine 5'-diphospho)-2-C-methyl-D-erythritol kinase [Geotoga petraea]MDK2945993.1 4-diphosphocytidyl-2-C-methyl-D-erythritol kinase [Geotoga sp.]TGG88471.1 4-(cytidine 5'-diphospho)-2-C-methyl-D-erythritol kinase [Geotoga petraea]SDC27684.1 4-diphosphocytidyl-2-C-methyl-D-erythritol kinase [Geotoga petraea]